MRRPLYYVNVGQRNSTRLRIRSHTHPKTASTEFIRTDTTLIHKRVYVVRQGVPTAEVVNFSNRLRTRVIQLQRFPFETPRARHIPRTAATDYLFKCPVYLRPSRTLPITYITLYICHMASPAFATPKTICPC